MKTQHEAGSILLSGPGKLKDQTYGVYLIRAPSKDSAQAIAASDPFTAAGHCDFDLIEWDVHQIMGAGPFTMTGLGR
jgi:uncharacterized protein YciI